MAALGSQSIASSYEQLLHVDRDGGGNSTTHVSVKDGDNGTTFGFTIASDALMMSSTNRLEFGDTGTYIHQSADGVLDLVSDTEIEINATTIDVNGALDLSGNAQLSGTVTVGADGSGTDVIFYSGTAGDNLTWDASDEKLIITGTNGATALDVADGNVSITDDLAVDGTSNLDNTDIDGTLTQDAGNVVFNEASADYDFRVESNGNANMLFVDGGNDRVGIGTASAYHTLAVANSSTVEPALVVSGGATSGFTGISLGYVPANNDHLCTWSSQQSSGANVLGFAIKPSNAANSTTVHNDAFFSSADNASFGRGALVVDNELEFWSLGGTAVTVDAVAALTLKHRISAAGEITSPLQPAFLVKPSSTQTGLTVTDGSLLIAMGSEIFDQGGDFASSTFTAPVTGRYQFSVQLLLTSVDFDVDYVGVQLTTSNRNYSGNLIDPGSFDQDAAYWTMNFSILADMDASDTALLRWRQSGGAVQIAAEADSYFSGFLAC